MKNVWNRILQALIFLRLVNGDGCLSITNIAVIVVIVKLALAAEVSFAEVATLLTVIGAYNFKRYQHRKDGSTQMVMPKLDLSELAEIKSDINKLKLSRGFVNVNEGSRES